MAMSNKSINTVNTAQEVASFLRQTAKTPAVRLGNAQGRLLFAMDATASREHTWQIARKLQSDMFTQASLLGGLDIQLIYFRGYGECKSSPWVNQPKVLHRFMAGVYCEAGTTQIERVLQHALRETRDKSIHALAYVGDCIEENIDQLGKLGGELRLLDVPLFIFQEGNDPIASSGFAQLARVNGGVHCRFNTNSAEDLGQLLNAAAIYAAGGKSALRQFSLTQSASVQALLEPLK